ATTVVLSLPAAPRGLTAAVVVTLGRPGWNSGKRSALCAWLLSAVNGATGGSVAGTNMCVAIRRPTKTPAAITPTMMLASEGVARMVTSYAAGGSHSSRSGRLTHPMGAGFRL